MYNLRLHIARTLRNCNNSKKSDQKQVAENTAVQHCPKYPEFPRAGDSIGRFQILDEVGEGSFGKVCKALDTATGCVVAIKTVPANSSSCEVEIMRKLQHPNIVQFKEVVKTVTLQFIVMEYIDGMPLSAYIAKMGSNMTPGLRSHLFRQLLSAVGALHEQHICHRDIKLENVMVTNTMQIKLIDFGLSKESLEPSTPCGSIHYAAPEIGISASYDGKMADMWSVGVCLYALMFRKLPFNSSARNLIRMEVRFASLTFPLQSSKEVRSLLKVLLDRNPFYRCSCDEAMQHPFLTNGSSIVSITIADDEEQSVYCEDE